MKRKAFAVCPTGLHWDMEKDGFQYFVCVNVSENGCRLIDDLFTHIFSHASNTEKDDFHAECMRYINAVNEIHIAD